MRNSPMLISLMLLAACGGGAGSPTTTVGADSAKDSTKTASAAKPKVAVVHVIRPVFDTAAAAGLHPLVRETYQYEGTTRDPFRPIVMAADRGPELPDLRLVAIIYDDQHADGSLATFRDIGNDHRYTLSPGQHLGRLSVVSITVNTVQLRQDDFGTERDQTYSLRKPEDEQP